jgi:XTP/dITP diphosphohydrolase
MSARPRWVLATHNTGKLREFAALLAPLGVELIAQGSLQIEPAPEPHATFIENALTKARHASARSGLPALADDSGLSVPALGGAPGVLSARYAAQTGLEPSDPANNGLLVRNLQAVADRRAYYVCALAFLRSSTDPCPLVVQSFWHGEIVDAPRGAGGFGYDAHFWLPDLQQTAANLAPADKNRLSHRGRALRALLEALADRGDGQVS